MEQEFMSVFSGAHILPFYPSSGDRGFAPITHYEVASEWGTWADIERIGADYLVMADLIAGHISTESPEYRDYVRNHQASPHASLFLSAKGIWPEETIPLEGLVNLSHYTQSIPLHLVSFDDGSKEFLFRSFLPQQADLDIRSETTRKLLISYIEGFHRHGIKVIRLDSIETLVKDPIDGYFSKEGRLEVTEWFQKELSTRQMRALAEVYIGQEAARSFHQRGLFTYGFGLVDHVLYSLYSRSVEYLVPFLNGTSAQEFTFISNHDGFVVGLNKIGVPHDKILPLRSWLFENAGETTKLSSGNCLQNINIHAINATLFEILGRDNKAWLLAQALVTFGPGIPIVYYNDLLCGKNDEELMHSTGEGRSLVRHNYTREEIRKAVANPSVQKLLSHIALRTSHSAFCGTHEWSIVSSSSLQGVWSGEHGSVEVVFDFESYDYEVRVVGA
jgi:sucrose phosphorylase